MQRIIDEKEMLSAIRSAKKILLVEPEYRRKYMPLGLAKISAYAKTHGAETRFARYWFGGQFDLVCISSLFTWTSETVLRKLKIFEAQPHVKNIICGGILASLMPELLIKNTTRTKIFTGFSPVLDAVPPDYETDWQVEDEQWQDFSFVHTSRGCPNGCKFCMVPRMEPEPCIVPNWQEHIRPDKPNVVMQDNNITATPRKHFRQVFDYLKENAKGVYVDGGFDCRRLDAEAISIIKGIKFVRVGLRIAFDSMAVDGIWQRVADKLLASGYHGTEILSFVLINFKDTPADAMYRMQECHKRKIWGYPQVFTPLDATDRKKPHLGPHWTLNMLRIFRQYWMLRCRTVNFWDWLDGDFAYKEKKYRLTDKEIRALKAKPK